MPLPFRYIFFIIFLSLSFSSRFRLLPCPFLFAISFLLSFFLSPSPPDFVYYHVPSFSLYLFYHLSFSLLLLQISFTTMSLPFRYIFFIIFLSLSFSSRFRLLPCPFLFAISFLSSFFLSPSPPDFVYYHVPSFSLYLFYHLSFSLLLLQISFTTMSLPFRYIFFIIFLSLSFSSRFRLLPCPFLLS